MDVMWRSDLNTIVRCSINFFTEPAARLIIIITNLFNMILSTPYDGVSNKQWNIVESGIKKHNPHSNPTNKMLIVISNISFKIKFDKKKKKIFDYVENVW
jgi:hypothetical protein